MSLLFSSRDICAIDSNLNVTMGYNTFETNSRVWVAENEVKADVIKYNVLWQASN